MTKTIEVKVPVKCKVREVKCDLGGNNIDTLIGLITCNRELREAIKECQ